MQKNVLCERDERVALTTLFEDFSVILQDCDDNNVKARIKNALQEMNDTTMYMVIGEEKVGKTSLINAVFENVFKASGEMIGDICEYRWGEQEFTTPIKEGFQKRFLASEELKGLSIVDTRGLECINKESFQKISEMAQKCGAIFVVLDVKRVNSPKVWDVIEKFPEKRMLFFLTKCDLVTKDDLDRSIDKIKVYMNESNISATVFPISLSETEKIPGVATIDNVRLHIKNQLIGENPILSKQRENIKEVKSLLAELHNSFALRKEQYHSDAEILLEINRSMDSYIVNHKTTITDFIDNLAIEINKDIDSYEEEIISKLDPYKIKERFQRKEDFEDYLNMVNENYKNMMNESINRKTIEAIKSCLHDLEIVFQEAVGYFNTRENILELNDRFYGSLSNSRKQMVVQTKNAVMETGEFYKTLNEASETLFLQIWEARKKYDAQIRNRKALSTIVGGGAGGTLGALGGLAIGASASAAATGAVSAAAGAVGVTTGAGTLAGIGTVAGTLVGGVALIALVGIGFIVGTVLINSIAKAIFDPRSASKLNEVTARCIEQFKEEVNHTRVKMIEQVSTQISSIFENELTSVDSCFTEFRMSINIDEKKLPIIEQRLLETEKLINAIDQM